MLFKKNTSFNLFERRDAHTDGRTDKLKPICSLLFKVGSIKTGKGEPQPNHRLGAVSNYLSKNED